MFNIKNCSFGILILAVLLIASSDVFACGTVLEEDIIINTWGIK